MTAILATVGVGSAQIPPACQQASLVLATADSQRNIPLSPESADYRKILYTTPLLLGDVLIGQLLSEYTRVTEGSSAYVPMVDTIVTTDGRIRIYGRASNDRSNNPGASGTILDVTVDGASTGIRGDYQYVLNAREELFLCFYLL